MKNFTKQNIKNCPLWIRLFIMTFMLFAGACAAFADGSAGGPKGVYLNVNGTNTWYNVYSTSWDYNPSCSGWNTFKSATSISGKDLGTVTTLQLKGYAVIGWTNNSDWVSGELRYQINSGSYTYFKVGNWDSGSSAANVQCTSGNDRVVGLNNQSVNLLTGLTPGNHTIKFMPSGRMRYNGGNFNPVSHPELSAKFTVPGYSTTTGTLAIGEVNIGSNKSVAKTMTHYGSTTTATYAISGTNASEFAVTSVSATSVTVKFTPTSAGAKTAKVTVTDAYSKTYTLTVTGTGKAESYTVKKSETGGTGTVTLGGTTITTGGVSISSGSKALSITAPTGYKVTAVSVSAGTLTAGTTGSSTYNGTLNVTAATTVTVTYAKLTYSISYNANGGSGTIATQTKTYGDAIILSNGSGLSKTGYTLDSWNTNSAGTGTKYKLSASYTTDAALTLYAQWTANTYTITYKDQGGENFSGIHATGYPTTHTYGATTTLKDPTKSGYNFLGWFTTSACTGTKVTSLGGTAYTADITLYAKWEKICIPADYTVSFANSATTVNKGSTLQASVSPSGLGYGTVTWSSSATSVATVNSSGLITGVKGGQATITATVAKGDTYCGGSATKTITVKETPTVTISGEQEFCTSTTLTATVTGITAGVSYSIAWYKDDGANAVAVGSTYSAKETGAYKAKVTGTYINERISADYAVTKKNAPATPDIKFTPNPVKEGTVTVLSIENYDPNNTYEFNGPDDLQGTMTQTTEFELSAGSYAFTVTATSKACPSVTATSETETLTVKEGGVAIDILGDAAIYSNDPTDFVAMYVTEKNGMADFPDAEGIAISSYTWEFSANGTSNWAACKEYDNATLGVKNNGSKCNNLRPNKVGYYRCVINYIDGAENYVGSLTSNVLQVTQAGNNPNTSSGKNQHIKSVGGNWTLPVISVNTGDKDFPTCSAGSYPSAQTDKLKKKRSVDVKIFNPDGTVYYDRKARMNYRGSSSLNFKKKSYAFCPGKENCGDDEDGADYVKTSKENLFGLSNGAKDKDWVLYAASADPSLMRNRLVFNTFKEMTGKWGVDTKYVELVVNGVYQGVYVLMDKITANEKRVDITDKNGFIVKFDKTDVADREKSLLEGGMEVGDEKTFMTTRTGRLGITTYGTKVDQLFEIEYPEKEDIEDEGGSWAVTLNFIKQKFEQFETALAKSDYATVRNLIDYQSWADWFIINEYTKNVDAYRASCVFVYNGDKIEVMPLWDQELSFNNQAGADIWKKGCDNTNGLLIQHEGVYTDCFPAPFWFIGKTVNFGSCGGNNGSSTITGTIGGYLINDACFVNTIKQRWSYHMQNSLSSTELKKKVDAYTSELTTAIKRESARWSDDFRCNAECGGGTGYNSQSYDNSLKTLNEWITGNRTTNLTAAISNLNGASSAGITITMEPTTGITTPWVPVKVLVNAPASATIKYDDTSITEGITEKKDKAIKTVNDKLYTYIFPRPTSWGTGNVATPIEQKTYEIRAIMTNASDDCPGVSNEAVATIKLADEGNDNCVENK